MRVFAFPSQPDSSINYFGTDHAVYRLLLTTGPVIDQITPLVRQPGVATARGWNLASPQVTMISHESWFGVDPAGGAIPIPGFDPALWPLVHGPVHVEEEASDSQPLEVAASVTGSIGQPGDIDHYRITVAKGQNVTFQIHARSLGSSLDAVLRLRNAAGEELKQVDDTDDSADPHFVQTIPADGEYTLDVSDRFRSGSERHFYGLVTQLATPEFDLSVAANRFTLDPTKPLEIPVTVVRRNGLTVPLAITLEGLPAGITCDPGISAPEGDTSKLVTLKVTATAEAAAFSGPVRIVGRTSGPDLVQAAKSPVEGLTAKTEALWLTWKK